MTATPIAKKLLPVLGVLMACVLSACDGATIPGLGDVAKKTPTGQTCFIADVSGSTYGPRIDGTYRRTIYASAARAGMEGSGQMCVEFAAGPQVQSGSFHQAYVGPTNRGNSRKSLDEIRSKVANATSSLDRSLANPPAHAQGSWLLYATARAAAQQALRPGDEIVFLSDMFEYSSYLDMGRDNTFEAGITTVLEQLRRDQLLPDLTGITLRVPHINESGRLDKKTGLIDRQTNLSAGRRARVVVFWQRYADATNATLTQEAAQSPIDIPPWVTEAPRR